jgi:hypothetical protein
MDTAEVRAGIVSNKDEPPTSEVNGKTGSEGIGAAPALAPTGMKSIEEGGSNEESAPGTGGKAGKSI